MELTPTTVRHWYIGDGSLNSNKYCVIYASNEKERPEYMESLFDNTPFNPSYNKCGGGALQFTRKESPEFLQWIGEPAKGYEYKWDIKR